MYNDKVIEIFKNPINVGEIKNPSGVGTVGNEVCGDIMKLYLKVDDKEVITDAKFKTFGCAAAIVSSSVATEMIRGKTINEALKFENQEILDYLGGLPPQKIHCSVLAKEAIEEAVKDYRNKKAKGKITTVKKVTSTKLAQKDSEKPAKKESLPLNKVKDIKKAEKNKVEEPKKVKFVKSDIDELIRTSNQLLSEIESSKFLRKNEKIEKTVGKSKKDNK